MRTKELNVPIDAMEAVADFIARHDIGNEILGSTEDGEIIIVVKYEKEERVAIFDLEEIIQDSMEE
jgi:hypothetical protein